MVETLKQSLSCPLCPAAMSSYLFIVKYELPEVIRAFLALEENSGWVYVLLKWYMFVCVHTAGIDLILISLQWMVPEWELPGGVCVSRNHSAFVSS